MSKVLIIAEAGVNHNGDPAIARRLIDAAKEAGADIVKFQTFKAENLASRFAPKAAYQQACTGSGESQLDMLRKLELTRQDFADLADYCRRREIQFLSTAFDLESLDVLNSLGQELFKIPSGEITNYPYLKKLAAWNRSLIMSTGMSDLGEIEAALAVLGTSGTPRDRVTLLHCTTEYPAPYADVNLMAMQTLRRTFNVRVGYSDHTSGIEVPIAAAALGAAVIEKHFTLDRNMSGPDHQASLEPHELANMVAAIRHIESALGDGVKQPAPSEKKNIVVARKSIVARVPIRKGERFTESNLTVKRPGNGISPMEWNRVLGTHAVRNFEIDECIDLR